MFGLFVKSLTPDDKHSRPNRENFWKLIQMRLSQKPKYFSYSLIAFFKSTSIFEYFGN